MDAFEYGFLNLCRITLKGEVRDVKGLAIVTTADQSKILAIGQSRLTSMNAVGREGWILEERQEFGAAEDNYRLHWINKLLDSEGMTLLELYYPEGYTRYFMRRSTPHQLP